MRLRPAESVFRYLQIDKNSSLSFCRSCSGTRPRCRFSLISSLRFPAARLGASGIRVGKSTRLPAKSQGLGSGSGSIPMMRLWECGNLAFCSRFPHFHSPCSTATRFRHADRRRPPRLGEHPSGRPTGRPPGGTGSTGRTRPATRAGSTHPKAGRAPVLLSRPQSTCRPAYLPTKLVVQPPRMVHATPYVSDARFRLDAKTIVPWKPQDHQKARPARALLVSPKRIIPAGYRAASGSSSAPCGMPCQTTSVRHNGCSSPSLCARTR